jgi:hypothetical protein
VSDLTHQVAAKTGHHLREAGGELAISPIPIANRLQTDMNIRFAWTTGVGNVLANFTDGHLNA